MLNNWFIGCQLHVNESALRELCGHRRARTRSARPASASFAVDQQQGAQSFRPGGNANRAFDLDEMMWDANGNLDPKGRLATDRPHVLKMYGAYIDAVRHADRPQSIRRQRHAADDLRQNHQRHGGLRRRPRRPGQDADACDDRPAALARIRDAQHEPHCGSS